MWVSQIQRFRSRILAPTEASRSNVSARLRCSESAPRFRLLAPTGHRIPTCPRMPRCSESAPRFRLLAPTGHRIPTCPRMPRCSESAPRFQSHALTGHRIPAQGANPGNPPVKTNPRSEGTPHSREPRTSTRLTLCGVPSEHTHSLGCGSQGDALGWYAWPIQGR